MKLLRLYHLIVITSDSEAILRLSVTKDCSVVEFALCKNERDPCNNIFLCRYFTEFLQFLILGQPRKYPTRFFSY